MIQGTRVSGFASGGVQRVSAVFQSVRAQPSWVTRIAILAMLVIIGLPIFLLIMLALAVGILVFGTLAGINLVVTWVRSVLPAHDGRENVRVIKRVD